MSRPSSMHTTVRYRWWYIAAAIVLLIVGITYGGGVFNKLKSGGFNDPHAESTLEAERAAAKFPMASPSLVVLMSDPQQTVDSPTYRAGAGQVLQQFAADKGVRSIVSFYNSGQADMVSRDGHQTFALVTLYGDEVEQAAVFKRLQDSIKPVGNLNVKLGGEVAANEQTSDQVKKDLETAEKWSFPFLAVLLVIIFRSLIAAALPLIIGGLSILIALILLRLVTTVTDISVFATNIITLLGLGLAIDYSLFFVSRFRDELGTAGNVHEALHRTRKTAGRTILFSGSIVSLSLLSLLVFSEGFLRSMALGGALTVLGAMVTALTVLPACLALLKHRINYLRIPVPSFGKRRPPGTWWNRLATAVVGHYPVVLVLTLAVLIIAGIPFTKAEFGPENAQHNLPPGSSSRVVNKNLKDNFASGEKASIEALVTENGSPLSTGSLAELRAYTDRLAALPNVRSVSSLATAVPGLDERAYAMFYSQQSNAQAALLRSNFVQGNDTLVMINYDAGLSNSQAQALVKAARAVQPPPGSKVLIGGEAAQLVDLLASLRSHLLPAVLIIVTATVVLLGLMLRSIVIPLTAVVLSTVSLSASFGAITWIFQDGNGQQLLDFTSSGFLDSTVPILIFAVAFGLAMDYEAFLISRMRERFDQTGDNTEAIVFGVTKTGRVISSAALLLVVVILALASSKIVSIKEIGIGLAIAVAVDVIFIRSLLVPAAMRLFGKANWWLP